MATPIDEYFKTKSAGQLRLPGFPSGMGDRVKDVATSAVSGGLAAAGAAGLGMAAAKIHDAITKRHDFSSMLENNPDLAEEFQKNPKFFNQAYSSLRAANPAFSKDPLISGNYMRKMMDSPLSAGGHIESAMGQVPRGRNSVMDAFGQGTFEGAKAGLK